MLGDALLIYYDINDEDRICAARCQKIDSSYTFICKLKENLKSTDDHIDIDFTNLPSTASGEPTPALEDAVSETTKTSMAQSGNGSFKKHSLLVPFLQRYQFFRTKKKALIDILILFKTNK